MRIPFLWAILLCLWPGAGLADGNAEAGRRIAIQHCSRCHVIPDHDPFGGIGSTPSFRLLARLEDGLERFETFFARRPHPSFVKVPGVAPPTKLPTALEPFEVTERNIADLVAYGQALRAGEETLIETEDDFLSEDSGGLSVTLEKGD